MSDDQNQVDFSHLILGFSSAALSYMGISMGEGLPQSDKNLALAGQNIEIINMLKAKTQGNLTADEDKLVSEILSDLQVKFAEASKS